MQPVQQSSAWPDLEHEDMVDDQLALILDVIATSHTSPGGRRSTWREQWLLHKLDRRDGAFGADQTALQLEPTEPE